MARIRLPSVDDRAIEYSGNRGSRFRYKTRPVPATIGRCRPILYVENDRIEKSPALIETIMSLGYTLYWHLPPLYHPSNYFGNENNVFGNIVSSNMLCVHSSIKSSITGLRQIQRADEHWMRK